MLPILIMTKGVYLYSGDYNFQTIPFIEHGSRLLHSGEPLPIYDWQSSLGMNTLNAYGSYILTPFSLLMFIVPVNMLKYFHGIVVALKMGVTALGAYIYCRQYVKYDRSAFICSILYAFSGYQLFNLVYPFMDSVALFPITLYAFDQLMTKRRSVWFALMLFLHGIFNSYFLWQECVFILVYFLVRVLMKSYPGFDLKLFFKLAFETLVGVGLAAVTMFPGLIGVSGNARAGDLIFSTNLISYETPGVIANIFTSMFFPPNECGLPWYFLDPKMNLDPPLLFIPFFFVIGVWAVMKRDKKSWYTRLVLVCLGILAIPILNSVFSAFNASFYARWVYMPVLIMVMMTGKFIDDIDEFSVSKELRILGAIVGFLVLWGLYCLYVMQLKDKMKGARFLWRLYVAVLILSYIILLLVIEPIPQKPKIFSTKNLTPIVCAFCTLFFMASSIQVTLGEYFEFLPNEYHRLWNDGVDIVLDDDQFFRVTTETQNDALTLGYPDIDFFNSMCTGEETDFYSRVGSFRQQNTNLTEKDYALYTFLSAKYLLYYDSLFMGEFKVAPENVQYHLKGYDDYEEFNWYIAFRNSVFIPMGFTYDYYLNVYDFKPAMGETKPVDDEIDVDDIADQLMKAVSKSSGEDEEDDETEDGSYKYTNLHDNEKLLLKAIWLTDDQIEKYGDILTELPEELAEDTSYKTYLEDCKARAASSCYEFEPDGKGFSAKTRLEKDNLVFFSIPYDKGFTAYVDGQETEIEKVFDGLSAVFVPAGDHSIRFDYRVIGLKEGAAVSVVCLSLLLIYSCGCFVLWLRRRKSPAEAAAQDAAPEMGLEAEKPAEDAPEEASAKEEEPQVSEADRSSKDDE
ncbi:MAG: YfhO family protein [Ruminococcus sp.]|nr:YfhO family protein [Ruminococcus sp.]